jgi:hypothetical protein
MKTRAFMDHLEKQAGITSGGIRFTRNLDRYADNVARSIFKRNNPTQAVNDIADRLSDEDAVRHLSSRFYNRLLTELRGAPDIAGMASPGSRAAWINSRTLRDMPVMDRRSMIAEEAFHAKNPWLGRSESLAHLYGGWKGPRAQDYSSKLQELRGRTANSIDMYDLYRRQRKAGLY